MFVVRPRGQTERGIKRERTLRTATDLVYKDPQPRGEGGGGCRWRRKIKEGWVGGGGGGVAREADARMLTYEAGPHNSL